MKLIIALFLVIAIIFASALPSVKEQDAKKEAKTVKIMKQMRVQGKTTFDLSCSCSTCPTLTTTSCATLSSICEPGADDDGTGVAVCTPGSTTASCAYSGTLSDDDLSCDDAQTVCVAVCGSIGCTTVTNTCSTDDGSSDNKCFHESTVITYKGKDYTLADLQANKEPECKIPHTPASKGVIITAKCGEEVHKVRVTDTHLMATSKGYQLAYSLQAGDIMFNDMEGKRMCNVTSVEKEQTTQKYFGLNCLASEVLANGIKASTFGDFHTLPSWYMSYVGNLVGVNTASMLGDYVAEWYFAKK